MKPYTLHPFRLCSCIVMLVAFLWFTIGATFVTIQQLKHSVQITATKDHNTDSENSPDPFANATEEKTESSSDIFSSEYLREDDENMPHKGIPLKHTRWHTAEIFSAFYGESVSPPPEI